MGWAVAYNGTIIYTEDGGQLWMTQESGTTKNLNEVYMFNATTGYVFG